MSIRALAIENRNWSDTQQHRRYDTTCTHKHIELVYLHRFVRNWIVKIHFWPLARYDLWQLVHLENKQTHWFGSNSFRTRNKTKCTSHKLYSRSFTRIALTWWNCAWLCVSSFTGASVGRQTACNSKRTTLHLNLCLLFLTKNKSDFSFMANSNLIINYNCEILYKRCTHQNESTKRADPCSSSEKFFNCKNNKLTTDKQRPENCVSLIMYALAAMLSSFWWGAFFMMHFFSPHFQRWRVNVLQQKKRVHSQP